MSEILTVEEIELIQLAMECLYSELPEYDSISTKLVAMRNLRWLNWKIQTHSSSALCPNCHRVLHQSTLESKK